MIKSGQRMKTNVRLWTEYFVNIFGSHFSTFYFYVQRDKIVLRQIIVVGSSLVHAMMIFFMICMIALLSANSILLFCSGALFSLMASLQSAIQSTATFLFQYLYRQADKHGKPQAVFIAVSFGLVIPFVLSM